MHSLTQSKILYFHLKTFRSRKLVNNASNIDLHTKFCIKTVAKALDASFINHKKTACQENEQNFFFPFVFFEIWVKTLLARAKTSRMNEQSLVRRK